MFTAVIQEYNYLLFYIFVSITIYSVIFVMKRMLDCLTMKHAGGGKKVSLLMICFALSLYLA